MSDIKRWFWSQSTLVITAMHLDFYENTNFSVPSKSPNKNTET